MRRKDGGPAFPVECDWMGGEVVQGVQTGNARGWHVGMTLRDYFAAKALQGMIAHHGNCYPESGAVDAYKWADAMLLAREN